MAFQFKHFKEILEEWLSYVVGHSTITDINPGSVVRTIGEATAIEAAQIYVQLQSILNLFSIDKASGEDLDERAADYGLTRNQPTKAIGVVTVGDSNLTVASINVSTLAVPLTAGVTTFATIQAANWAAFPAAGTMILDRGDVVLRESIAWVSKTSPDKLNFPGATFTVNNHVVGSTVHKSTVGSDRAITLGNVLKTLPPAELKFETTAAATLYDGDYQVDVPVESQETGAENNVSAGKIVVFESVPFPTATVTNADVLTGGEDFESDETFRERIKNALQSLSSSTAFRIEREALLVEITLPSPQRVITAKVIEPITPGESTLYINDGTASYSPGTTSVVPLAPRNGEFLIAVAEAGQVRAGLAFWPIVSGSERIFVSKERGTATSSALTSLTDSTKTWVVNEWAGFRLKDENKVIWTITSNTATVLTVTSNGITPNVGAYAIFHPTTAFPAGSLLTPAVDYIINNTNGQLELTVTSFPTGLTAQDCLVAYYNGVTAAYVYYNGLLREVQRVINGDPSDLDNYPGVKAAGSVVNVVAPGIITVTVVATLSVKPGFDEATIRPLVATAILDYINNLTIGEDVIRSKIIEVAMSVNGVFDIGVVTPATNTVVTNSQLAKTTLGNITVS